MDVKFAVLADAANSTADGKLNLLGVFDRIWLEGAPAMFMGAVIVARVTYRSVEAGQQYPLQFVLIDQDGGRLWAADGELRISDKASIVEGYRDMIIPTGPWPLPILGRYSVEILIGGQVKQTIPFEVQLKGKVTDNAEGNESAPSDDEDQDQ